MALVTSHRKHMARLSAVIFMGAMIALQLLDGEARNSLVWERDAISSGQLWRVLTGSFLHITWTHLTVNLLGYGLLMVLYDKLLDAGEHLLIVFALAIAVGAQLYMLSDVGWYLGFSGVLVGLYMYLAVTKFNPLPLQGSIILGVIVLKVARERWFAFDSVEWFGDSIPLAADAHLFGAFGGLMLGLIRLMCSTCRTN